MGLVFAEVAFNGPAPDLHRLADKISELSGLSLSVTELNADAKGDVSGPCRLAFACAPEEQLELVIRRAGTVKEYARAAAAGQTVYLRSCLGQDVTLMMVTTLALEALGGRSRHPIPEDVRREYGTPMTAAQLLERRRKLRKQARWTSALVLLLVPVLVPLWLLWFAAFLVTLPWWMWKAYRLYRKGNAH